MTADTHLQSASSGLWVVFLGPDGVGKSAVIESMKEHVAAAFAGTLQFHFRPNFCRRDSVHLPVKAPHDQCPRTLLLSVGKLLFWLLDYWFSYWLVVRSALRKSHLVVFDRFYPDMLVDPLRYRLPQSSLRFARWIGACLPRPHLYVLLDAPAEIVQRRKQEVSLRESQRQRLAYLEMFRAMPCTLMVDASYPADEVAGQVSNAISAFLVQHPMEPYETPVFTNF